ncbi:MAG: iron ABC transporter permease, partial [Hydrogenophaga sp.]|nr:iron ABC transporter permease [Hydrogenophaga sp.]NIN56221.1 iron ABC transporter permease [Hydrogenophaga sp.]NIO52444.1 iron ABC transporter permease [Hydrogenophaga sp.]NIO90696.1 iron ABC transporter permease [Hydrogenophaga sp.]NIQ47122.1 iron ABC transporter permease [Hydrogenophaga sp.]
VTLCRMTRRDLGPNLFTWALLALLGAVLLWPIWLTVRGGFEAADGGFTLYHIIQVAADPVLREGLINAFAIAICTTLLSLVLSLPLAILAARYEFPGKQLLGVFILVPLILPPFVGAIGIHQLFGRYGAVNTLLENLGLVEQGIDFIGRGGFWAVVIIEALHLYPILYLNLVAALSNL